MIKRELSVLDIFETLKKNKVLFLLCPLIALTIGFSVKELVPATLNTEAAIHLSLINVADQLPAVAQLKNCSTFHSNITPDNLKIVFSSVESLKEKGVKNIPHSVSLNRYVRSLKIYQNFRYLYVNFKANSEEFAHSLLEQIISEIKIREKAYFDHISNCIQVELQDLGDSKKKLTKNLDEISEVLDTIDSKSQRKTLNLLMYFKAKHTGELQNVSKKILYLENLNSNLKNNNNTELEAPPILHGKPGRLGLIKYIVNYILIGIFFAIVFSFMRSVTLSTDNKGN